MLKGSLGISTRGIYILKTFIKSVDAKRVLIDPNIISLSRKRISLDMLLLENINPILSMLKNGQF